MNYLQILGMIYLVYRASRKSMKVVYSPTKAAQAHIENAEKIKNILSNGYEDFSVKVVKRISVGVALTFLSLDAAVIWYLFVA